MAADFLKSHGIDLDAEMARIQNNPSSDLSKPADTKPVTLIRNISLPQTQPGTRWDISITDGRISRITPHDTTQATSSPHATSQPAAAAGRVIEGNSALLTPSLCHPHIHIDKAYLLSHPTHSHLRIQQGDFAEAMALTGRAKAAFTPQDLLERGQRVLDESVAAGVTHMRAFVELDAGVGTKCLDAGLELKARAEREGRCKVQVCAFAQLALFSASPGDEDGAVIRGLMEQAAAREGVDCVGSTPYVEHERWRMERNVLWMVELSKSNGVHLDFHLDYHLHPETEPMVWFVVRALKEEKWMERCGDSAKTVALGHCTRLTLFTPEEWRRLRDEIGDLPISFVGLPTSDMFMMRTPDRTRGTLNVNELIQEYGFNACLGINNIGNAFTPHGSCDPLTLACNGVGVYQAGRESDADVLFECVSTRARRAIGLDEKKEGNDESGLKLKEGDPANLLLFATERQEWRTRKSVAEAVYLYDSANRRQGFLEGVPTTNEQL